jgi:ABC-type nitrate/sulfonate/bicarbonate transport system permease component
MNRASGSAVARGWPPAEAPTSRLASVAVPLALAAIWQMLAGLEASPDPFSPWGIVRAGWIGLTEGQLAGGIVVSWRTVDQGFVIATVLGVPLGVTSAYWPGLGRWVNPILNVLRPIAPFAWIPMAILWFGASLGASVTISAYAAFFPILTNANSGVGRVRTAMVVAARTLGANRWTVFRRVIIPSALPLTFVGLRLGMGLAWAAVVAAELAIGKSTSAPPGIGYLMYLNFAVESDLNAIGSMMVAVGISALAADWLLRRLQAAIIHWPTE